MTLRIATAIGSEFNLGAVDSLIITQNAVAHSLFSDVAGVHGIGSAHWVMVEGTASGGFGISLGDDGGVDAQESVQVSQTGLVAAMDAGILLNA